MLIPTISSDDMIMQKILDPIILFTPFLPMDLFFLLDIIWIGIKFKYEKEHLLNFPSEFFHITDPNVFSDFAHVEYALFDKTGTLTERNPIISSIFFNGKIYNLENCSNFFTAIQSNNVIETECVLEKSIEKDKGTLICKKSLKQYAMDLEENLNSDQNIPSFLQKNMQNLAFLTSTYKFIQETKHYKISLYESEKIYIDGLQEDMNGIKEIQKLSEHSKSIESDPNEKEMKETALQKIIFYNPLIKEFDKDYFKIDEIYDEETLLEDAKKHQSKFFNLFEFFAVCHSSFPQKIPATGQINYISQDKESETILKFCEKCGFVFEKANKVENPDEYTLRLNGFKQIKYKLFGIIDFSSTRKTFSMIYQNPFNKQYLLIVKGPETEIRSKLQMTSSDEEKFNIVMKTFSKKGLIPLIYAYKIFEEKEAKSFGRKIKNLKSSLINQSEQLDQLAEELEINLQIMSIVGFKELIKPQAKGLIEFLQSVNIKPWILSGDLKEKAVGVSLNLNIITQENEPLTIETNKKEDLVLEIRNILSILKANAHSYYNPHELKEKEELKTGKFHKNKKEFKNNLNYSNSKYFLLINGQSLNTIEKDPYLAPHLAYICFLVRTVIGFNLSPWNKRVLAQIIKNKFPRKPIFMAVGDGYNDILMLQTADVGVEIVNKSNNGRYESIIMAGDIKISNLNQIKEVMTQQSLNHAEILYDIIYYTSFKSILLGLQIFMFNFYNKFTGSPFQDSISILIYFFYFTLPLEIIYGVFYNRLDKNLLKKIPELYIHGLSIKRKRQQKKMLVGVFVESIISAFLIFYSTIYVVNSSKSSDGYTNDLNLQALTCLYASLIVLFFRILSNFIAQMKKFQAVFLVVGLCVMLAAFLVFEKEKNFSGRFISENSFQIVSQFAIFMALAFVVLISVFFEMFVKLIFFQKWFPNPYHQVVRHLKKNVNAELKQIINFLKNFIKKQMYFIFNEIFFIIIDY